MNTQDELEMLRAKIDLYEDYVDKIENILFEIGLDSEEEAADVEIFTCDLIEELQKVDRQFA